MLCRVIMCVDLRTGWPLERSTLNVDEFEMRAEILTDHHAITKA